MLLPLYVTHDLSNGASLVLYRWGPLEFERSSTELYRFILWYGNAFFDGTVIESIPEQMHAVLHGVIRRSSRLEALPDLSYSDLLEIAAALWSLNGLGGDSIKKMLDLFREVLEKQVQHKKLQALNP